MFTDYQSLPLPPPWMYIMTNIIERNVDNDDNCSNDNNDIKGYDDCNNNSSNDIHRTTTVRTNSSYDITASAGHYYNDITKEISLMHPLLKYKKRNAEKNQENFHEVREKITNSNNDNLQPKPYSIKDIDNDLEELIINNHRNRTGKEYDSDSNIENNTARELITEITETNKNSHDDVNTCLEFKCTWKEIGLFGDTNIFGLTIRYCIDHDNTSIRFDGVQGEWVYSALDGAYGPVTRHDLFIGCKIFYSFFCRLVYIYKLYI